MKRSSSTSFEDDSEDDDFSSSKRSTKKSSTTKTVISDVKKERMIRNRHAAQASRERKKAHQLNLENKVKELEALLQSSSSSTPTIPELNSFATSPTSSTSSNISTSSISTTSRSSLENENEILRAQLKLEELQSENLRNRLNSLEDKFSRLESLLSNGVTSTPEAVVVVPVVEKGMEVVIPKVLKEDQVDVFAKDLLSKTLQSVPKEFLSPLIPLPPTQQRLTLSQILSSIQVPSLISNMNLIHLPTSTIQIINSKENFPLMRFGMNGQLESRRMKKTFKRNCGQMIRSRLNNNNRQKFHLVIKRS